MTRRESVLGEVKLGESILMASHEIRLIDPGYDVKLHPAVLPLLSSLGRLLRRSLEPLRYW